MGLTVKAIRFRFLIPVFLAVTVAVGLLATLESYGMDEDTPFHFLRGQAYLDYFLTGRSVIDQPKLMSPVFFVPGQRISEYKINAWESSLAPIVPVQSPIDQPTIQQVFRRYQEIYGRKTFYKHSAWSAERIVVDDGPGHPPVSDILEAISNRVFYEKLGWVGDIEGYYLFVIFSAVFSVLMVYWFALSIWGPVAGLFSALSLFLFPLFFAESHFNIKDIPELAFFSGSVIFSYFWVTRRKARYLWGAGISFFIALGTKLNALFVPVTVGVWLLTLVRSEVFKKWFGVKAVVQGVVVLGVVGGALLLVWPWLKTDTWSKIISEIQLYAGVVYSNQLIERPGGVSLWGVTITSLVDVFAVMPITTLFLFLVGLGVFIARVREKSGDNARLLVVIWFAVSVVKMVQPSAQNFGSPRQFIEYLPAMMIIVGWGASEILSWLKGLAMPRLQPGFISGVEPDVYQLTKAGKYQGGLLFRVVLLIFSGGYFLSLVWIVIKYFPNQNVYFNQLVGGTSGAKELQVMTWQTNYHNAYREAANWLSLNAEKDARLGRLDGTMEAISPLWLREDIHFGSFFSGFEQKGEYVVTGHFFPSEPAVFPYLYLVRFLEPVYEVKEGGVTLAAIYKNDRDHVKKKYQREIQLTDFPKLIFGQDQLGKYWEINLPRGRIYSLTRLVIRSLQSDCVRSTGVFSLPKFISPWRVEVADGTSEYQFPAEVTQTIRYYPLADDSCFGQPQVLNVSVLE